MASEHSKEMAKGAFWSIAGQLGIKLIGFFYLVILARMASQDDVGTFYLALSIFGVLSVFSDAGFTSSFSRYVPYLLAKGEKAKLRALLNISYVIVTVLCVALGLISLLAADMIAGYFHNPQLALPLKLLSPYLLLNTLFTLDTSFLSGRKMMKEYSTLLNAQTLAKFVLTLLFFFVIGATMFSIAASFLLSFILVLVLSFVYLRKPFEDLGHEMANVDMGAFLLEVVPFGLMMTTINSLWMLVNYTDRILIGYMMAPSVAAQMVAVYSLATGVSMLVMLFPNAISLIFFPMISELVGHGKNEAVIELCETCIRWIIFVTFPLTLVMLVFPDSILRMFYGDSYVVGATALAIFTLGLFFRALSTVESLVLGSLRLLDIELKVALVCAVLNVILNVLFIPSFGINGAAVASAIAFLASALMFIYYARKHMGFRFPPEMLKSLLAGVIALGVILLIKPYLTQAISALPALGTGDTALLLAKTMRLSALAMLFVISGLVYVGLLFALKSFSHEDISIMSDTLKRAKVPADWADRITAVFQRGVHS